MQGRVCAHGTGKTIGRNHCRSGTGVDLDDEIACASLERLIGMPSSPGRIRAVSEVAGQQNYRAFVRTRAPSPVGASQVEPSRNRSA